MFEPLKNKTLKPILSSALPLIAVLGFGLAPFPWIGAAVAALAYAYVWFLTGTGGLGKYRTSRTLLPLALLYPAFADAGFGLDTAVLTAAGVTIAALNLFDVEIADARKLRARMRAANLDYPAETHPAFMSTKAPYSIHMALTAALGLTALSGLTPWPVLALAGAGAVAFAAVYLRTLRYRRAFNAKGSFNTEVRDALAEHGPRFGIYFMNNPGALFHINMWIDYLDQLEVPYYILVRTERTVPAAAAITDQPVVFAPTVDDLEPLIVPSLKAFLYVNNRGDNLQMVRRRDLTHISLYHGDSDKAVTYSPLFAMYDKLFVAGQAAVDRFSAHGIDIPDRKFAIVGRPQLAGIQPGPRGGDDRPTVLYAPTWSGGEVNDYCSLAKGLEIIEALLRRGVRVVNRAHPVTRHNPVTRKQLQAIEARLAEDDKATGAGHKWGAAAEKQMSLVDCINAADAMICDVSGVASDWLYSEKPMAMTDMVGAGERFTEDFPLSRAAYHLKGDTSNLDEVLDDLLKNDPLAERRRGLKRHYLGDIPHEKYVTTFLDELRKYL